MRVDTHGRPDHNRTSCAMDTQGESYVHWPARDSGLIRQAGTHGRPVRSSASVDVWLPHGTPFWSPFSPHVHPSAQPHPGVREKKVALLSCRRLAHHVVYTPGVCLGQDTSSDGGLRLSSRGLSMHSPVHVRPSSF